MRGLCTEFFDCFLNLNSHTQRILCHSKSLNPKRSLAPLAPEARRGEGLGVRGLCTEFFDCFLNLNSHTQRILTYSKFWYPKRSLAPLAPEERRGEGLKH